MTTRTEAWPTLDYAAWRDTGAGLHLWTQIVGKFRLANTPWVKHAWHQALLRIEPVFQRFRTGFLEKVSPVHPMPK